MQIDHFGTGLTILVSFASSDRGCSRVLTALGSWMGDFCSWVLTALWRSGLGGVFAEEELAVVAAEEEGEAVQVGAQGVRPVGGVADVGQE